MITIHLRSGELRAQLDSLSRLLDHPRPMLMAATGAVRKLLQGHFRDRQQTPNKLGGRRTNFWQDVYRSTQIGEVTDRQGVVVIGDARFAQKVYGGTITAGKGTSSKTGKPTKYLSIPARREAYGLRPSQLEDKLGTELRFVKGSRGGALMVKTGKKSQLGLVMYWLTASVTQAPDPQALPPRDKIEQTAVDAAEGYLRTVVRRNQPIA
jgi:hypothetical protein